MISRRIRMNDPSKSSCVRLINYLMNDQGNEARIQDFHVTNCESDSPKWAALEMLTTQRQNTRAKGDKTYHLMISFPAGEHPSKEVLQKIEERICASLGYEEHQRVSVLHGDTENLHLHVAINKIHPRKLTMHEPYYDQKRLASISEKLEKEFGLSLDNHSSKDKAKETAAVNMEKAGGLESLIGWIQRNCLKELKEAKTWEEFKAILKDNSLEVQCRGNGFIFSSNGIHVKGSSIDRNLSKKKLEQRYGAFETSSFNGCLAIGEDTVDKKEKRKKLKKEYVQQPYSQKFDTTILWKQYNEDVAQRDKERSEALLGISQKHKNLVAETRATYKTKSFLIKHLTRGSLIKRLLYLLNRIWLKKKLEEIKKQYKEERKQIYKNFSHMRWNDWLGNQALNGNQEAIKTMRARRPRKEKELTSLQKEKSKVLAKGSKNEGIIIDCGSAPYKFNSGEKMSYYATIQLENGQEKMFWGKDIQRALNEAQVAVGDTVKLENVGREQVRVTTGSEPISTYRNTWKAEKVGVTKQAVSRLPKKRLVDGLSEYEQLLQNASTQDKLQSRIGKKHSDTQRNIAHREGVLLRHGTASYNFIPEEKESYFVTLQLDNGKEKTIWGKDLARALEESQTQTGDKVRLEYMGNQEVTVEQSIKDKEGKITGSKTITTHRNTWKVKKLEGRKEASEYEESAHEWNSIAGVINQKNGMKALNAPSLKLAKVTKKGSFIYTNGIMDTGAQLVLPQGADEAVIKAGLELARLKFDGKLSLTGTDAYKEGVLRIAAQEHFPVTFEDKKLEARKSQLMLEQKKAGHQRWQGRGR